MSQHVFPHTLKIRQLVGDQPKWSYVAHSDVEKHLFAERPHTRPHAHDHRNLLFLEKRAQDSHCKFQRFNCALSIIVRIWFGNAHIQGERARCWRNDVAQRCNSKYRPWWPNALIAEDTPAPRRETS